MISESEFFTEGDQTRTLAKKENTTEDDVLMFYNTYSPPTSFDIDDNGNAIQKTLNVGYFHMYLNKESQRLSK